MLRVLTVYLPLARSNVPLPTQSSMTNAVRDPISFLPRPSTLIQLCSSSRVQRHLSLTLCADHLLMELIDEASNPGVAATFDHFQTDCLTAFDPRSLLDIISSAQCCGGASNGHSIAATSPLSDHSCDANSGGLGATWYQIDEQMTDHASGVAFCATQGASLCPRSHYCVQGVGGPPVGGRRSGDNWAPTSDGDNTWIQVRPFRPIVLSLTTQPTRMSFCCLC